MNFSFQNQLLSIYRSLLPLAIYVYCIYLANDFNIYNQNIVFPIQRKVIFEYLWQYHLQCSTCRQYIKATYFQTGKNNRWFPLLYITLYIFIVVRLSKSPIHEEIITSSFLNTNVSRMSTNFPSDFIIVFRSPINNTYFIKYST